MSAQWLAWASQGDGPFILLQVFLAGVFVGQLVALVIWSLPTINKKSRGVS